MERPRLIVPIFAGLSDAALDLLANESHRVEFEAGVPIVKEGDSSNRLYVVESGSVRICKRWGEPDEVELVKLGPGDFFGEMCILETLPRSATVLSVTVTVLCRLSSITFYHLHKALPDQHGILVLNIARDLSRRLRRLDEIFAARH